MTILRNTKPEMERRYKIMHLPETAMLDTLLINATLPGDCVCKLSFEGVEEGTQVIDRFYSHEWQSEAVLLYNPLWPKLGDGEVVTIIPAVVKTVIVDLRIPREPKDCLQPLSKQIGVDLVPKADLIARMTETPSLDSLHQTEDIRPKGDPIRVRVIDRNAGEPVQESKEGDTWRDRKTLL